MAELIVAALATWRITSMIIWDKGPFDLFWKTRSWAVRHHQTAQLFSCPYCLSVWIGALVTAVMLVYWWVLIPFALSGVTVIIERALQRAESSR